MTASVWLPLYGLFYAAAALYWAHRASRENGGGETFFSAGHALPPWIAVTTLGGMCFSGWFLLGGAAEIARHGLTLPALFQAGIALALPGTLFFKRVWLVGERLRVSSQPELFRHGYDSRFLAVAAAAVAVLLAVGFAGLQLRALARLLSELSGGEISPPIAGVLLGILPFAYVVIGGMRAVGYFGVVQAVLAAAATLAAAAAALVASGGFDALSGGLAALAADPSTSALFSVDGVIHFTAGRDGGDGFAPTALTSLGVALALMGLQTSPLAIKLVLSTRSPGGFGAGQIWVVAGGLGAVVLIATALVGAAGMVDPGRDLGRLLAGLGAVSPWFMAWIAIGVVAGVQLLAGLALLVAAEALVRHLYKPEFHAALSRRATIALTRIVAGLLALGSLLLQVLAPVTLSALGGVALPLSVQLATPLLGLTWLPWITRSAAACGVGFGFAAVLLTEPLGYQILSAVGLELPWGRWPWTLPSAVWGLAANAAATLVVAAITRGRARGEVALEVRRFLATALAPRRRIDGLTSFAWSVTLAWAFFAIGPGLVFGNFAFGDPAAGSTWIAGVPSIWAWSVAGWAIGVVLVWFLAYRMEMADATVIAVPPYAPRPRLVRENERRAAEARRLRVVAITAAVVFAAAVILVLGFGGG